MLDQGLLDYDDGELIPIKDIGKYENKPIPVKTSHIISPNPQILKYNLPIHIFIEDIDMLKKAPIPTKI